jgi:hypothetical protein
MIKSLENKFKAEYKKDYFFYIYNKMIKRQLNRLLNETIVEEKAEPIIKY